MKSAKSEILREQLPNSVPACTRIRLVIRGVPTSTAQEIESQVEQFLKGASGPLFAVGLMRHEVKMSVVHYRVIKSIDYPTPIANKEQFLFVSGFRWFSAAPLFSSDNVRWIVIPHAFDLDNV